MRVLAIDPGQRRMGIALSDETATLASGLDTFDRKKQGDFVAHLRGLVERHDVQEVVVGLPVHLSGAEGESSQRARDLAADLQKTLAIPVVLWDERFSSEEARRVLRGSRPQKETIDKLAAVIILQSYLDYKKDAHA